MVLREDPILTMALDTASNKIQPCFFMALLADLCGALLYRLDEWTFAILSGGLDLCVSQALPTLNRLLYDLLTSIKIQTCQLHMSFDA
jgi:hypothetical protein